MEGLLDSLYIFDVFETRRTYIQLVRVRNAQFRPIDKSPPSQRCFDAATASPYRLYTASVTFVANTPFPTRLSPFPSSSRTIARTLCGRSPKLRCATKKRCLHLDRSLLNRELNSRSPKISSGPRTTPTNPEFGVCALEESCDLQETLASPTPNGHAGLTWKEGDVLRIV